MNMNELFGEAIYGYSRRQAIEDGVLVQLSGPGYEGDPWLPEMVREAGFTVPVAMTVEAFTTYVWPLDDPKGEAWLKERCQDMKGRMWDVLWMLRHAIDRHRDGSELVFEFRCVVRSSRPQRCRLKAAIGPDDDGNPCLTIMEVGQD
jgi:hypothetical protein